MATKFSKDGVCTIVGKTKGPVSAIIAGVHGNEPCGPDALKKILPKLQIDAGTLYIILANPKALKKKVRFTEFNLNRAFKDAKDYSPKIKKTYEYKRAQFIKKILNKVDVTLDLHSTKNKSTPFIVCEKNAYPFVRDFPRRATRIVSGFYKVQPGATDDYMYRHGKVGITVECGMHTDKKASALAEEAIMTFLKVRGHLLKKVPIKTDLQREYLHVEKLYVTKKNFILQEQHNDFEWIKKGYHIGNDGKKKILAPYDAYLLFAHDCDTPSMEAFLLAKKL